MALSYCTITIFSKLQALTFYTFFAAFSILFIHLFMLIQFFFLIYAIHLSDSLCVILILLRLIYDSQQCCEASELAEVSFHFELHIVFARSLAKPVPNSILY